MPFKSVKSNVAYAVFLFVIIFVILYIESRLKIELGNEFIGLRRFIFLACSYPIIGAVLGLPNLWKQFKENGSWRVNGPRILVIGLPAFVLANFFLLSFLFTETLQPMLLDFKSLTLMSESMTSIFQIVFSFIIMTSFYKEKTLRPEIK